MFLHIKCSPKRSWTMDHFLQHRSLALSSKQLPSRNQSEPCWLRIWDQCPWLMVKGFMKWLGSSILNTLPQQKLIQDINTRWNSTYHMIKRLLKQCWPVTATLPDPEVTPRGKHYFDLKPDQWVLLEELAQGLQPFECATLYLSGQEHATLPCLPQLIKRLQWSIQHTLFWNKPRESIFGQCRKRYKQEMGSLTIISAEGRNLIVLSASLDPWFRKLKFVAAEDVTRVKGTVEILSIKEVKECGIHGRVLIHTGM